ncbi:hypothetical protein B0H67DRAFT_611518 [Lasiosphaeris hirsuta]|uniref:FAD-binding domain-containing protein n=1 Tax=Lasiosphaeris hirsuta TaxID=260670 RepID=A0AA40DTL0_9PEZI|nr:hypothetical protein B0H67DRAFT_611518 [Lasiosphaeris hirsuta]
MAISEAVPGNQRLHVPIVGWLGGNNLVLLYRQQRADGAFSAVRRILAPDNCEAQLLPCKALGTSYTISLTKLQKLRSQADSLYFFGTDPKTDIFAFCIQLYYSWIPKDGDAELEGMSPRDVFLLKGSTMFPALRSVMDEMPQDTVVSWVNLVEWPAVSWDNWDGVATLTGDSAHCMSIYRGEGVNHGIIDGCVLAGALKRAADSLATPKQAVQDYEAEMRLRRKEAVDVSH